MRPLVIASVAASLDGFIDDTGPDRLVLSNAEDLDRVDEVRAGVDAILVGAGTVRADDPRLQVRAEWRRTQREHAGLAPDPVKVVLTGGGQLQREARVFASGQTLVYVGGGAAEGTRCGLGTVATVVDAGAELDPGWVLDDLAGRGVARLLIEGGSSVHSMFLSAGLVDELQLVLAPRLLGTTGDPRFVQRRAFPQRGWRLAAMRRMDDLVLLRYVVEGWNGGGRDD